MSAGAAKRLGFVWLPFAVTLVAARGRRVGTWEHVATRRVNRFPEVLHGPLWVVMQSGALGAPLVAGGAAMVAGRRGLAVASSGQGWARTCSRRASSVSSDEAGPGNW